MLTLFHSGSFRISPSYRIINSLVNQVGKHRCDFAGNIIFVEKHPRCFWRTSPIYTNKLEFNSRRSTGDDKYDAT